MSTPTHHTADEHQKWRHFAGLSPEQVRTLEKQAMRGLCDLNLVPPRVEIEPGPRHRNAAMLYAQAPGIEITPGGRLWCLWLGSEDGPTSFMVAARSDDRGETWTDTVLAVDARSPNLPVPRGIRDSVFWTDPRGRLWLFVHQNMNYTDGRDGFWAAHCDNPDADSPVWSAFERVWHGLTLAKPIVLSTGEWMLAASLIEKLPGGVRVRPEDAQSDTPGIREARSWEGVCYAGPWPNRSVYPGLHVDDPAEKLRQVVEFLEANNPVVPMNGPIFSDLFPELDPFRGVNIVVSSDEGATWTHRASIPTPDPWWHEPQLVEKKDGSLWLLIRQKNEPVESFSTDGGFTWSTPALPAEIRHPSSRFALKRLHSGNLLFVKHGETIGTHEGRSKLTAWISKDDGVSWQGGLMLDERERIAYPDVTQAPDGTIFLVYDRLRATAGEILLCRITEDDIVAGKLIHPNSRLKMIVRSGFRAGQAV